MIDMFGGSGGFTTGYVNFINNKDIDKKINWKNEITLKKRHKQYLTIIVKIVL